MSKNWYPIVNKDECIECGVCVDMCPNNVYDKTKSPKPLVTNPEGCTEGCTGCGKACPVGAIEYLGDNKTKEAGFGCKSEEKVEEKSKSGCGSGCSCGGKC